MTETTTRPVTLSKHKVRELSELQPRRAITQIAFEWLTIAGVICLAEIFSNPAVYMLAVIAIGTRQHAIGVLLHDAVHYRLTRNRKLNDLLGHWLLAWPFVFSLSGYRSQHLAHHQTTGTAADPDFIRLRKHHRYTFPKNRREFFRIALGYLSGMYALSEAKDVKENIWMRSSRKETILSLAGYAVLALALIHFGLFLELVMYWFIPLNTVTLFILYMRMIAEHSALPGGANLFDNTRHTDPRWWERILISPNNVNYHLDHHLYPSVPFYRLPDLHEALVGDAKYSTGSVQARGYFSGVLDACFRLK